MKFDWIISPLIKSSYTWACLEREWCVRGTLALETSKPVY